MLYFIDESGHDHGASPYEVLAAVAVQERELWNLIQAIRSAELEFFGISFASVGIEMKGAKLLKKKTFRLASEAEAIPAEERRNLVRALVIAGHEAEKTGVQAAVTFRGLVAYGQTVIAFVERVFTLMTRYRGDPAQQHEQAHPIGTGAAGQNAFRATIRGAKARRGHASPSSAL